jgi:hypothetical protein
MTYEAPVPSDEKPHPPYTCPKCGKSYDPHRKADPETKEHRREREESVSRAALKRKELAARKAKGLPLIWTVPEKLTPEQRKSAREANKSREREINEILSKNERSAPAGRKSDPAYDKAAYRVRIAEICGRKISTSNLVREILATDKSDHEYKLDKIKKALKRRKRKR